MRKPRRIKIIVLSLVTLLVVGVLCVAVDIWLYGSVDETTDVDTIIVLGAGVDGEEPSPVFRERIEHALWLYEHGYATTIIFTGGVPEGGERSDASVARDYAIESGIPPQDIFVEESSTITQENISNAAEIMASNNLHSALVVSDPLHMRRAMLMAEDSGLRAFSSPTPTTMYKTPGTQVPFLAREVFFYIGYLLVGRL